MHYNNMPTANMYTASPALSQVRTAAALRTLAAIEALRALKSVKK